MAELKTKRLVDEIRELATQPGQKVPASNLLSKGSMDDAALVSKLVRNPLGDVADPTKEDGNVGMLLAGLERISKSVMARIEDNENISKLFPDIELAIQIIVSSVLSPKDMLSTELIFQAEDARLPSTVTKALIEIIRRELSRNYKLEDELQDILRDALFDHGSHVKIILPESAVDQLINPNVSVRETISEMRLDANASLKHMGFLGNAKVAKKRQYVAESFQEIRKQGYDPRLAVVNENDRELVEKLAEFIQITDDYTLLKTSHAMDRIGAEIVQENAPNALTRHLKTAKRKLPTLVTENYYQQITIDPANKSKKPSRAELTNMLYKSGASQYKPYLTVPTQSALLRRSVGRPLYMTWPSEAMIPVYKPGDPKDHIGYFALIDLEGNAITLESLTNDSGQSLNSMMQMDKNNTSLSSMLTDKARRNLSDNTVVPEIDRITEVYASLIEQDLIERLRNGAHNRTLRIGRNNEIYRIMLTRTLKGQMTRVVYLPAEYVTYYAFKYHRNGVGKSYLDDLSNITSLRAMVLFSNVMAKVKAAISVTNVDINFDPRDPDPVKTIEMVKHLVARARQQYFPHGLNRVVDLTDWIQRAGIEITWQGHPKLPNTKIEFSTKNLEPIKADEELDERFRHQTYMHLGLSPETVDSAAKTEFAATIYQGNVLFSRRIKLLGREFSIKNTDCVRKIVSNDEVILSELFSALKQYHGDLEKLLDDEEKTLFQDDPTGLYAYIVQDFLEHLSVELPSPDLNSLENLAKEFEAYDRAVDGTLKYIFSPDVLPEEFAGEASAHLPALTAAWKAEIMRRWMANNNYMPEVFDIATRGEDDKPLVNLLDSTKTHSEGVMLSAMSYLKAMKQLKAAVAKDMSRINPGEPSDVSSGSSGESNPFDNPTTDDEFGGEGSPFDNPPEEDEGGGETGDNPFM